MVVIDLVGWPESSVGQEMYTSVSNGHGVKELKLRDKVVVVTGSTRGIGLAIAEACAREGARVVVSSRHEEAVRAAVDALAGEGLQVSGRAANVAQPEDLDQLLQHAIDRWKRVDVWINNAGLSAGLRPVDEMAPEEIQEIVDTNLTGTILACRLVIPYFVQQGGGVLINMSGRGGRGDPTPFTAVYGATKSAVISLTRSLAQENKSKPVSIHVVLPGMVATDFYRDMKVSPKLTATGQSMPYVLKAVGGPVEEVARLFVTIAAQEPGKVTGKTYSVFKGGKMMRAMAQLMWYRATGKIR